VQLKLKILHQKSKSASASLGLCPQTPYWNCASGPLSPGKTPKPVLQSSLKKALQEDDENRS